MWSKKQSCQFKLKFGIEKNSNIQNSICFQREIPFFGKLGPKNQKCQLELKFSTYSVGQNIVDKSTKLSNICLSMKYFIAIFCNFVAQLSKFAFWVAG